MKSVQFSSGRLPFGILILCGILIEFLIGVLFWDLPHSSTLALVLSSALFILGAFGLIRPRLVTLDANSLTLRPTFGRQQRWERRQIISTEEIVFPPFATLIARVTDGAGKHRKITLSNRLTMARSGIRHHGREVGTTPSSRLSLVQAWLKDAL